MGCILYPILKDGMYSGPEIHGFSPVGSQYGNFCSVPRYFSRNLQKPETRPIFAMAKMSPRESRFLVNSSNLCAHGSDVVSDLEPVQYRLRAGFGLVIGCTSVPRSEVEWCSSNHINISSECHHTFPGIRELLRQMGSGLVVTK